MHDLESIYKWSKRRPLAKVASQLRRKAMKRTSQTKEHDEKEEKGATEFRCDERFRCVYIQCYRESLQKLKIYSDYMIKRLYVI